MKLSAAEAARFIDQPDRSLAGVLIYGADPVEISDRKQRVCRALLGSGSDIDLRLTQISATDVRRDPAIVIDALKALGFFEGPRVVTVEDVGDSHCAALTSALADWRRADAFLVATAGVLPARSKLRKLFETAPNAAAAPCYADRLTTEDVQRMVSASVGARATGEALEALRAFGAAAGAGAARDLIERLALYHLQDGGEITAEDVETLGRGADDAGIDDLIDATILGESGALSAMLRRLEIQGQSSIAVTRNLSWRFRQLHIVAAAGSAEAAISKLRPPVFGARRDTLMKAARSWPVRRVEGALRLILDLDDQLRGSAGVSGFALVERCLLKLSLTVARGRG